MSPERSQAYRRVVQTLTELGPAKLQAAELEQIRDAADTLIFSQDLTDDLAARQALAGVGGLCRALVDSGRWEAVTADRLASDVSQCGPPPAAELKAA
jgi:hypothetical protein